MSTVHVPEVIQIADRPGTVQCPWLRMLPQGLFVLFDMVTCVVLILLLGRKGLDQRRVILYAWCQLPIIECAMQRHVDVIPLTFTILAAAYGFFAAFASEQGQNAGVTQQIVHWLGDRLHLSLTRTITVSESVVT